MTPSPTNELRSWILDVAGEESVEQLDSIWADFQAQQKPVVTLFGAFDTGKSSVLKRILLDSGELVPEWLTISARHETFTDQHVAVAGCILRDTPGLSPDGTDARSIKNSQLARSNLGLTDVLMVTLNPQLATGERSELLDILSHGWLDSRVWFLISRADEGGIDPALDPTGFEEWKERKRVELRNSLKLANNAPIYVVVPDYGQIGAFETQPDPSIWDASRPWDGMAALESALASLSEIDLRKERKDTEARFWKYAVLDRIEGERSKLAELATMRDTAISALGKRDLFLEQLESLANACRVSIEGTVEDAVRRVMLNPDIDAESIQSVVNPVLQEWWEEQQAELARLRSDAIKTFDQQRAGRAWKAFESLYSPSVEPATERQTGTRVFTPRFSALGQKAVDSLWAVDEIRRAHLAARNASKAAESSKTSLNLGQFAGIGAAALPFLIELSSLVEEKVQSELDKGRLKERRQQVQADVTRIVKQAARAAITNLTPDIEALRQELTEQTGGETNVEDLRAAVVLAEDLVARGDVLCSRKK